MTSLSTGGGSSAVAASAHAGCERFRRTDPMITHVSRSALADHLGFADTSAGIPEARWMRAMTFESLVHSERFVSELVTKAVGQLGLERPVAVRRASGHVGLAATAAALRDAHDHAVSDRQATMITSLAVPYVGMSDRDDATPIKPDFAIVCPRTDEGGAVLGSWLIMGDAKDYERVRSKIDDGRMLKGFLQVALGAEAAAEWNALPTGMRVHDWGALAVPRNAFLQPEAVVERLDDHRYEVLARARERVAVMEDLGEERPTEEELSDYVAHIEAAFDPASCTTCSLYAFCRDELRGRNDAEALLAEIGIDPFLRPAVVGLVDGTGTIGDAPVDTLDQVRATVNGLPIWRERSRTDPIGSAGCVRVIVAKSDAAALGVHGLAVRGPGQDAGWNVRTFEQPQAPQTRLAVMSAVGQAVREVVESSDDPIHLVVPDAPTADVLVSIADSLAGVELSRLRWQRDLDEGREPLTFDGEPATVPDPLPDEARIAVSLLLEEDRARAMSLRQPVIDLRRTLASHLVVGGPSSESGRLDYLLAWAEAGDPVDHRAVSDDVATRPHTPGARLVNATSDAIHAASRRGSPDWPTYERLVRDELAYKCAVVDRAEAVLETLPTSALRDAYRALEADAQEVWRRRLALRASDLVRFSRTYRYWRNAQVEMLESDASCASQLTALTDPARAHELAADAGTRDLALATVVALDPIRLRVRSRRIGAGSDVVALHIDGRPVVEESSATVKIQIGSFKLGRIAVGELVDTGDDELLWTPAKPPVLEVGSEIVLASTSWFNSRLRSGHEVTVKRPGVDNRAAPKPTCTPTSYADDPAEHQWCCRPHEAVEAEYADQLAERRERGELNPQAWPPIVDTDRFDTGEDVSADVAAPGTSAPRELTLDDVD
ncbi:hypothetical protein CLV56_3254 [Mumia flava]|uniref:Uncharacterized protein n=1 Tax=Mumia flava TaxID=1348852 RepID=A0A0B2BNE5_9ACTN|nr:hypothetical protein [Mumia flava]PJJ53760.1 hypothetical protein CLV56_3254 [Mumia flava]